MATRLSWGMQRAQEDMRFAGEFDNLFVAYQLVDADLILQCCGSKLMCSHRNVHVMFPLQMCLERVDSANMVGVPVGENNLSDRTSLGDQFADAVREFFLLIFVR